MRRVVVKVGTHVLSEQNRLCKERILNLVEFLVALMENHEVILVSSGAVAAGYSILKLDKKLLHNRQAIAAVGQPQLMAIYNKKLEKFGKSGAQLLLTADDFDSRKRCYHAKCTIDTLLENGILPIINENDTVAIDEIKFGDNDNLAAMIANIIEADLFINLTATDGLYDCNPSQSKKAKLIPLVCEITNEIEAAATMETSSVGTGGMKSKILAAKKVTSLGIPCIIAPGKRKKVLSEIMAGKEIGTLFLPQASRLASRKYWIANTLRPRGRLIIDDGAKKALLEKGKSLLPSGVTAVEGTFVPGDPVVCVDQNGTILAKGLVNFDSSDVFKIMGLKTTQIDAVLGHKDYDEVIHRDNLVITDSVKKNKS